MQPDPSPPAPSLPAIRERVQAATPGPWYVDIYGPAVDCAAVGPLGMVDGLARLPLGDRTCLGDEEQQANAVFIAHAREDVPALLAYAERLEAQITDLRAALDGTALVRLGDASPCWCPHARPHGDARRTEHTEACLAARAALGEPE